MTTAQSQLYLWRDPFDRSWFLIGCRTEMSNGDLISPTYRYLAYISFHIDQINDLLGYAQFERLEYASQDEFPMPVELNLSLPAKVGAA